jgi:hypothetical protein
MEEDRHGGGKGGRTQIRTSGWIMRDYEGTDNLMEEQ